jgi:hypothetical protein
MAEEISGDLESLTIDPAKSANTARGAEGLHHRPTVEVPSRQFVGLPDFTPARHI